VRWDPVEVEPCPKALMARGQDMAAHAALKAEVALAAVKGDRVVRAGGSFVPREQSVSSKIQRKGFYLQADDDR
jgi:hypothetical protein